MFNSFSLLRPGRSAVLGIGVVLAAVMALTGVEVAAQSPSLAEVARKEQERRKTLPNSTKVYTSKDLPKTAPRPEGQTAPAAEPSSAIPVEGQAATAEPAAGQEPDQKPAQDEAAWRKRIADAREGLRRSDMFAAALQTRINSLTNDFQSRDDVVQRDRVGVERKEAVNELARVKQEIERGKKLIADIEEEARTAGVPPGWLR